ncbi:MAG: alpha/beta hydrolase [Alphaproteobacteria bacterium]|nr:alpha/beta hydrolase [Alphaproteobacteria bacterium]MCW5742735.1 alpha/beta hydrolase [Alphaproteobacteria bacterium]
MATYVLVHGPSQGGWIFGRVAKLLRAKGHDVYTPTLTGAGDRSHIRAEANLSLHIEDVANVLRYEALNDVVLCGHAYGGFVISGVADHMPGRVRSLVYIDSFIPENGDALWKHMPVPFVPMFLGSTAGQGGLRIEPVPGEVFNLNMADREMFDARCTGMPIACLLEAIQLNGAWRTVRNRHYVSTTGWAPSPFLAEAEKLKAEPGWKLHSSPAGHLVMLDDPQFVADVLQRAV